MKRSGVFVLVIFVILFSSFVVAQEEYKVTLLAVQESGEELRGSDADLILELRPGTGRVFLDTFPLTKLDTQISTRYAKEVACNHFKLDCEKYDFIFTIRAKSNIIGGPSAGAAVAALTTIAVLDLEYDESVAITGTINSGGVVGPVGGVKEKIEAAADVSISKVLITTGTGVQSIEENNQSKEFDVVKYGKDNLSVDVVEVLELDEVIYEFTGKHINGVDVEIKENKEYSKIMQGLKERLCERHEKMHSEIYENKAVINASILEDIKRRVNVANNASNAEEYYAAASFCFGANIDLRREYYYAKKPSVSDVQKLFFELESNTKDMQDTIVNESIETISDVQTLMVVQERLHDVEEQVRLFDELLLEQNASEKISEDTKRQMYGLLAYAQERFYSAVSWAEFFTMDGKKFVVDEEVLEQSCVKKISESEERQQYVNLFIPAAGIDEKIESSKRAKQDGEFTLCLISASQAKADASAVLSSIGLGNNTVEKFIDSKRRAVERVIAENSAEGIFPILGYSYYQYANALREDNPYTALVYYEYALEMSALDIYFPEEKKVEVSYEIEEKWMYLIVGILIGITLMYLYNSKYFDYLRK